MLEDEMTIEGFWQNQEKAKKITSERNKEKQKIDAWDSIFKKVTETISLAELSEIEDDQSVVSDIENEIKSLKKEIKKFEFTTLMTGAYDANNAILSIHSGAGGTEAQDWVDMLLRMYLHWCDEKRYATSILDILPGECAGTKNVTVLVEGNYAYGFLRTEKGVHRLVRISPFDANKRRHTSFAAVDVLPEIEDDIVVNLNPDDLKIDTYRASGAGGQHVNKTSSAVRITHIPTGIVVQCQNERSQHKNKENAMKILKARIFDRLEKEKEKKITEIQGEQKDIAWGSQIRSYVFQPYTMIKDLRTRIETGNIQAVMDGDIDEFIWGYLKSEKKKS